MPKATTVNIGDVYGYFRVVDNSDKTDATHSRFFKVKCTFCGYETERGAYRIKTLYRGCRCQGVGGNHKTHGMSRTRPYKAWDNMIHRCMNDTYYAKISVCDEWKTFGGFWNDMQDGYADNLWLDRIDNTKGYYKDNCRWTTATQQQTNRRNTVWCEYDGKLYSASHLARTLGVSRHKAKLYRTKDLLHKEYAVL